MRIAYRGSRPLRRLSRIQACEQGANYIVAIRDRSILRRRHNGNDRLKGCGVTDTIRARVALACRPAHGSRKGGLSLRTGKITGKEKKWAPRADALRPRSRASCAAFLHSWLGF